MLIADNPHQSRGIVLQSYRDGDGQSGAQPEEGGIQAQMDRKRILFVDDEASIRVTLPPVLEQHGFEMRVAASVPDALFEINSHSFDVLLCDLNISEEGDGFLVVSAMRHLQPDCVNVILTGYPALETALQAIRNQVDDYLVKPVDLDLVVKTIRERLQNRTSKLSSSGKGLFAALEENRALIITRTLQEMKQHPRLSSLSLSDGERIDQIAGLVSSLSEDVEIEDDTRGFEAQGLAFEYGRQRKKQGYIVPMVVVDFQLLRQALYEFILHRFLDLEFSNFVADLMKLDKRLDLLIQKALEAYARSKRASVSTH
jgi:ActR/RegA family two-component response regulator